MQEPGKKTEESNRRHFSNVLPSREISLDQERALQTALRPILEHVLQVGHISPDGFLFCCFSLLNPIELLV